MRIVLSLAVCAVATLPAMATPAADALNAVAKCAEISGTPERLQCFDAAAVGAKQVLDDARKQAEAEQQPESKESLLSWFGFSPAEKPVTKPEDFGKSVSLEPKTNEVTEISSKVIEFAQNAHGKSIFILDNGQVWRQIDGDNSEFYYREKDGPLQITISRGMMGSFVLKAEGKSGSLKVRRVK
jgi:hypothetical protein